MRVRSNKLNEPLEGGKIMLRNIAIICVAILLGWSFGVRAEEIPSAGLAQESFAATGTGGAADSATARKELRNRINALQVPFIANDERSSETGVKYFAKTLAGSVLVDDGGIVYQLKRGSRQNASVVPIRETWIKPKESRVTGLKPSTAQFSFFKGADQKKWKRNASAYDEVGFGQVYDGVFVTLKAYNNNVEKIFNVNSGADPRRIAIRVEGISDLRVNRAGELELVSRDGTLKMTVPVAYQEVNGQRQYVKAAYSRLSRNSYGFKVAKYDKSQPLVIDPMVASTFLGDTDSDFGYAIDSDGASIYVTGWTNSAYFPITDGVYNPIQNGGSYDVFVSKFNAALTTLQASTFLGGSYDDFGTAIACADGVVFVAGSTKSSDFPIPVADNGTTTAYDTRTNGNQDAFLCRLSNDLTDLQLATYLGGTGADQLYVMKAALVPTYDAVHPRLLYLAGTTQSKDFPVLADSAFSVVHSGNNDVFVSAFDAELRLHYSTLLGGTASDIPYALEVLAEKVFVAGSTLSTNFPTTPGAYRRVLAGSKSDAFISRLDFSLGVLEGSTLLGGSTDDAAYALVLDGNATTIKGVYVAGFTNSVNFPTLTRYTKGKKTNGKEDGFVAWLSPDLKGRFQTSGKYAATVFGGSQSDYAVAMKLDPSHQLVVTGNTKSTNFPIIPAASPPTKPYTQHNGGDDCFAMILDDNLTVLAPIVESTFVGGSADDRPVGLFVDTGGDIFIVGTTKSSNYPATDYQVTIGGKEDVFISVFSGGVR